MMRAEAVVHQLSDIDNSQLAIRQLHEFFIVKVQAFETKPAVTDCSAPSHPTLDGSILKGW